MNKFAWGLVLAVALTGSAAVADTIEEAVGNTVVVRLADGTVERYLFDADHTFTVQTSEGEMTGTWALNGGEVCVDFGEDEPICEDYPKGKKLGDTWTEVDDDDGSSLTISIEPR
jgi:hypothetical protein